MSTTQAELSAAQLCSDWPLASANPRAMVCVLAKQQFCDVHLFAVLLASEHLCDERAYLYTLGAHLPQRISTGPGTRCVVCSCAVEIVIWHLFLGQYGFDATMRMTRLGGTRDFPFLVFEQFCCVGLGLLVR